MIAWIAAAVMVLVAIGFVMWVAQMRRQAEPLPSSRNNATPQQAAFYASRPFMLAGIVVSLINAWAFALFGQKAGSTALGVMIAVAVVAVGLVAYVTQRVIAKNIDGPDSKTPDDSGSGIQDASEEGQR